MNRKFNSFPTLAKMLLCSAMLFLSIKSTNAQVTAICQDITVQLDAAGNVSIDAIDVDNGSSSPDGIFSYGLSQDVFNCSNIGFNVVELTVMDMVGAVGTCFSTITVEDNIPPTAITQNIIRQIDASGIVIINAAEIDGGSFDNCSFSMSVSPDMFDCSNIGDNTVILTVTDTYGNWTTSTATVTLEDNFIPTAICQNITAQLDITGNITLNAGQANNGSSDNCSFSMSLVPDMFDCSNLGTNPAVLTITDVFSNTATCLTVITIEDNIAPTPVCQNITAQLDATGNVIINAGLINLGTVDNCSFSMEVVPSSFNCSNIGANMVLFTVTDAALNSATCNAIVTVLSNGTPCFQLPLELINFEAKKINNQNALFWATATEENTDYFVVERSANGIDEFVAIENKIAANGNSNTTKNYSLIDKNPLLNSYYRLKMVDKTGEFSYSKIISVINKTNFGETVSIYPNPTHSNIEISYPSPTNSIINFTVLDILGKIISQTAFLAKEGTNTATISLDNQPTGIYFIQIQNEQSEQIIRKIIKN